MLQYSELAKQRLSEGCASFDQASYQSELTWFMKITWNIALQAGDAYLEMRQAFDACQKVSLVYCCEFFKPCSFLSCFLLTKQQQIDVRRVI